MDTQVVLDGLGRSSVLAGLPRSARRALAALAEPRDAGTGDVLLREGTETDALGVVLSGRVGLRLLIPERGPMTVLTVEPGDVFGWSAVVPPYRSTSTAVAIEPTLAVLFPARRLRDALEADDDLAASLYPRLLQAVARRLEATRLQLLDLFGREGATPW